MTKRLIAFPYYGGKNYHVAWLVPLLPYGKVYVEPFGGSAAILLNRKPSPVEVYNDIDGAIVNFFRVLRENGEDLIKKLALTPYSRKELSECQEPTPDDPIEWARRTFVQARQSVMGIKDGRSWATTKEIRKGTSQMISRWSGGIETLYPVIARLRRVMLECRPAIELFDIFDSSDSVFYLDPPYPRDARKCFNDYRHEMSNEDHKLLVDRVLTLEGKVAISSYHNTLYDKAFEDWWIHEEREKELAGGRGLRQEVLWMNYDPKAVVDQGQTRISDF